MIKDLKYAVGALLYTPATDEKTAHKLSKYLALPSLAFCLEDAIPDRILEKAEATLAASLASIAEHQCASLPLLFVRVRSPAHLEKVYQKIAPFSAVLTGFILPKYDLSNAEDYEKAIISINENRKNALYVMPILESKSILYRESRLETLVALKKHIDRIADFVLTIRTGGNDFCHIFGLRRRIGQTIYDIAVVRDALADILNLFTRDYTVSAPVWEYFDTNSGLLWKEGLEREVSLDVLNGFIGKTAIHPSQVPVIMAGLKVKRSDYEDALHILHWDNAETAVAKSSGGRMNEQKTHTEWARRTKILADIYGIAD
jgi:citrate lyase beta subunit